MKNIENKIEALIEEANRELQQSVSKYRPISDTLTMAPVIGGFGQMAQGYTVGKEVGHPVAGLILGAEAAAGAKSKHDDSVSVGDVYTKGNIAKRAGQGAVLGAVTGAINSRIQSGMQTPEVQDELRNMADQDGLGGYGASEALYAANDPLAYSGEQALITALGAGAIAPGLKYGLGKLFGSKTPNAVRAIK